MQKFFMVHEVNRLANISLIFCDWMLMVPLFNEVSTHLQLLSQTHVGSIVIDMFLKPNLTYWEFNRCYITCNYLTTLVPVTSLS